MKKERKTKISKSEYDGFPDIYSKNDLPLYKELIDCIAYGKQCGTCRHMRWFQHIGIENKCVLKFDENEKYTSIQQDDCCNQYEKRKLKTKDGKFHIEINGTEKHIPMEEIESL